MKIDDMIKREEFFKILQETLNEHYKDFSFTIDKSSCEKNTKVLFIYDKLNAIVDINPSKQVKDFLKTEYSIKGFFLRKVIVKLYLNIVLNAKGLLSMQRKLYVSGKHDLNFTDVLIYPCNKKIRIFEFSKQQVNVITKSGFPFTAMKKEIDFRIKHNSPHIQPIINYDENWYCEKIIDGKPLARIQGNEEEYIFLKKKSLAILKGITAPYGKAVNSIDYKNQLITNVRELSNYLLRERPVLLTLSNVIKILNEELLGFDQEINLTLSHGDFHHGNIWIENSSKKIILIDWETADIRSEWYDEFTLFAGLREINGIKNLLTNLHNKSAVDIAGIISVNDIENVVLLVLLEDLQFRVIDLACTPLDIGIHEFESYCTELLSQLKGNF